MSANSNSPLSYSLHLCPFRIIVKWLVALYVYIYVSIATPFAPFVEMIQLSQFSHETANPECSITTAFWTKFEQLHALVSSEHYWSLWMLTVTWSYWISTVGNVISPSKFSTTYLISRCRVFILPKSKCAVSQSPLRHVMGSVLVHQGQWFLHNTADKQTNRPENRLYRLSVQSCTYFHSIVKDLSNTFSTTALSATLSREANRPFLILWIDNCCKWIVKLTG